MSTITFCVRLSLLSSEEESVRIRATRSIIEALTGISDIRQQCLILPGQVRDFHITLCQEKIPHKWISEATMLVKMALLDNVIWSGEIGPEHPTGMPSAIDYSWHIVPDEASEGSVTFLCQSPIGKIEAATRWDGCTHLWIGDKRDYQHICDLDEHIAYLQSGRDKARRYFNGEFCLAPVSKGEVRQKVQEFQQEETFDS